MVTLKTRDYMPQRMPFASVFEVIDEDSITPRFTIRVGGVTVAAGETIRKGFVVGGTELTQFIGRELSVDVEDDVYIIKGIY